MRVEMKDGKCPICGKEPTHVKEWPVSRTISAWCDMCGCGLYAKIEEKNYENQRND